MGSAFTEQEKKIIKKQLKEYAKECLSQYGIKKTTVDDLVQKVGISKGAFYKFYSSKELLFFEVIEDFHEEFYTVAINILRDRTDLDVKERVEKAIWESVLFIQSAPIMMDLQNEMHYLLRKIPQEVLKNHYKTGDTSIENIIKASGIPICVPPEFISAAIHGIEVLIMHKEDIGDEYFLEILNLYIKSLAEKIV